MRTQGHRLKQMGNMGKRILEGIQENKVKQGNKESVYVTLELKRKAKEMLIGSLKVSTS